MLFIIIVIVIFIFCMFMFLVLFLSLLFQVLGWAVKVAKIKKSVKRTVKIMTIIVNCSGIAAAIIIIVL